MLRDERGDILKLHAYRAPRIQEHRGAFSASILQSTELAIQVRGSDQALETHTLSQGHGKGAGNKNPHFFVWEQALFDWAYQIFWQEFEILVKMVA